MQVRPISPIGQYLIPTRPSPIVAMHSDESGSYVWVEGGWTFIQLHRNPYFKIGPYKALSGWEYRQDPSIAWLIHQLDIATQKVLLTVYGVAGYHLYCVRY